MTACIEDSGERMRHSRAGRGAFRFNRHLGNLGKLWLEVSSCNNWRGPISKVP
jgi:hypothetical protein